MKQLLRSQKANCRQLTVEEVRWVVLENMPKLPGKYSTHKCFEEDSYV